MNENINENMSLEELKEEGRLKIEERESNIYKVLFGYTIGFIVTTSLVAVLKISFLY